MNVEDFLSRLKKVRKSGPGEWLACCPAHDDRSPSLGVKQGDDGRILVKCFALCSFEDICGAAGVRPSDMMPESVRMNGENLPRMPFSPLTCMKAMAFNAQILCIIAEDIAAGREVPRADIETAYKIRQELEEVIRYATR